MVRRLEPLNLMDFTGGLNLRRTQFLLAENESPDMLNIDVDPRGGFYTRRGWSRWNDADIVDVEVEDWKPRNAWVHNWANGNQIVYVANNHKLYSAGTDGIFTQVAGVTGDADPHQVDEAPWGDDIYLACGMFRPSVRRHQADPVTALADDTWSEVDAPTSNTMPQAEFVEAHAGYLFVACTAEADGNHFARIRWSHPSKPDSWRADDYLDIDTGGGKITALVSFQDHLLIFKTNSMWALYGYDEDSWQLIRKSVAIGCPSQAAVTRNEAAVAFFSVSNRGGVYRYTGDVPEYISEQLRPALEEVFAYHNVFVSWAGRRLWVSVPWIKDVASTADVSTTFVFDHDIGAGAWTMYRSDYGTIAPVIDGSDINAKYPLSALWSTYTACLVTLDALPDAFDLILPDVTIGVSQDGDPDLGYLVTEGDVDITATTAVGQPFTSYYRTRWLHAGWPDRKKSWRRPTFICRQVPQQTELLVETYRDYDEATIHRSRTLYLRAIGPSYWTEDGFDDAEAGGFDWKEQGLASPDGRGADWGKERRGSTLQRAGSMGLARAIQMRITASPNTPRHRWGVDGVVAKFVARRFR